MNLNKITRLFNRQLFVIKKHIPDILTVVGIGGVLTGTVLACKATTRIKPIIDDHEDKVTYIHVVDDKILPKNEKGRELLKVYGETGVELLKLYGPAIAVNICSILCIVSSDKKMKRNTLALGAGYSALMNEYLSYRKRVADKYGKDAELELYRGDRYLVEKNEEENSVNIRVNRMDIGEYTKLFDETSRYYTKTPAINFAFLRKKQEEANHLLKIRGYLFYNEVLKMLDLPLVSEGDYIGWVYDNNMIVGNNYVDFGLTDFTSESVRYFINGRESVVMLNFNLDGYIYDSI